MIIPRGIAQGRISDADQQTDRQAKGGTVLPRSARAVPESGAAGHECIQCLIRMWGGE